MIQDIIAELEAIRGKIILEKQHLKDNGPIEEESPEWYLESDLEEASDQVRDAIELLERALEADLENVA